MSLHDLRPLDAVAIETSSLMPRLNDHGKPWICQLNGAIVLHPDNLPWLRLELSRHNLNLYIREALALAPSTPVAI